MVEAPAYDGRSASDHHVDEQAAAEIAACFGHYAVDVTAWTVRWSVGVAAIFGRPMPMSGLLDLDEHLACYHPDDAASSKAALSAAIAGPYGEGPYRNQGRVVRPDGTIRYVMAQGTGRSNGRGRLLATSGILVDVTETVDAERAARDNGEMLRATVEAIDQGIIMVSADQYIRVVNAKAKTLLDLPDHLARAGMPFADLLLHQEQSGEFASLSEAERACLPIYSEEASAKSYTRQRPNGTILEIRTSALGDGGFVRTYSDVTERRNREAALAESEQRYRLLAENTTDTIIMCDLEMRRRYVSPSVKALLGYEPEELLGTKPTDTVHPDDEKAYAAEIGTMMHGNAKQTRTKRRYLRKDGSLVWVDLTASVVQEPSTGAVIGYVAALRDHSAQVEAEEALRLSEQRLAFALGSGGDGVWSYDCNQDRVVLAGRWWAILGYGEDEIEPTFAGWHALSHPEDRERVERVMTDHLEGRTPSIEVEYRVRSKSGTYVWTLARGRVANTAADGRASLLIGTHMDITRRKEVEQALARAAHHDVLTGLPNRALFHERLQERIGEAERHGDGFAVLACDLDRFKAVNDTLGHAAGDALLREIAKRLLAVIRTGDTVARIGGDEFSIVLGRLTDQEDAYIAARRVIEVVGQPFVVGGREVQVGASIGIAFGPADGRSVDDLCRRADTAMYVAKTGGRNTFRAYHASLEAALVGRAKLEDDLQDAVKRGGFLLCYQPIFGLRTGEVSSFEALLRWHHPTRGPIAPDEFIPMAEQTGLMVRLGEWTLREACREAATWPGVPRVAVNISGTHFRQTGLEQCVLSALATSGLNPDRLILEVTEEVLIDDPEVVFASLLRLRGLGVRIALDKFGTGHSGLNHLRRFPFAAIKLHQSLVRDLARPEAAAMARAIVGLCSAPGVEVVAEGVETRDELNLVRGVGCTAVQGFLFSKPLLAEDAVRLVGADCAVRAA